MKKNPLIFLTHIQESIQYIEKFTNNISKSDFLNSVQIQDAVIRRLEIIGEATKNLPIDLRKQYPQVRWEDIAGMRDKLIHHYFGIDLKITWTVVKKDIPQLKKHIKTILKSEK